MARQADAIGIVGTIGNVCFYKMWGNYYLRTKSSLKGKRVKKSPAFKRTMEYAGWLSKASKIGSAIYNTFPASIRKVAMYRAITGEAMQLFKTGKTGEEVRNYLWQKHVEKKPVPALEKAKISSRVRTKEKVIPAPPRPEISARDYYRYVLAVRKDEQENYPKKRERAKRLG